MRYKLIKATRRLRILLGGYKGMEKKHKLFILPYIPVQALANKLIKHGWYYNTLSTTYRKQIYTVRRLPDLDHQYHLRFYSDGWVSGHYELRPDSHPLEHLDGIGLRALLPVEVSEIKAMFEEVK